LGPKLERQKLGVVARPIPEQPCLTGPPQETSDVAVGIKDANGWHTLREELLLPTGLAQK
jgi:hypothetical protein